MKIIEVIDSVFTNLSDYLIITNTPDILDKYKKVIKVNLDPFNQVKLLYDDDTSKAIVRKVLVNEYPMFYKYLKQLDYLTENEPFITIENVSNDSGYEGFSIENQEGNFSKNTIERKLIDKKEIYNTLLNDFNNITYKIAEMIIDSVLTQYQDATEE